MQAFKPVIIASNINKSIINPGETLFVTVTWENRGELQSDKQFSFYMDIEFGHQRKIENKQYDFRVTAQSFLPVTKWTKGTVTEITFRWENMCNWSGTFHLSIGILDGIQPIMFFDENDNSIYRKHIGDVDVSWNLGRPWVKDNSVSKVDVITNPLVTKSTKKIQTEEIVLSGDIEVVLAKHSPSIKKFGSCRFSFCSPLAVIQDSNNGKIYNDGEKYVHTSYMLKHYTKTNAEYEAVTVCENKTAVTFLVSVLLSQRTISVTLSKRVEHLPYTLIELRYTSFAELTDGYLLDFYGGGRLVEIKNAAPLFFEKKYDVRNASVLYNHDSMIIVESEHIDSKLSTGICSVNSQKSGFIGGSIVCRIPSKSAVPSIFVKEPPVFTVELTDTGAKKINWQLAASYLRRNVKPNPARDLYRNSFFYKQLATWGPMPDKDVLAQDKHILTQNLAKTVTFDQITENVESFYNLTDGAKQIVYVTGWQKGGFDDAYPEPYDAEERCGGLKKLSECLINTRKYNTFSGLHDNFDDISYPNRESNMAAIDEYGKKWGGWVWAAGITYSTALTKYVETGEVSKRIKKMTELLPLEKTYHIDVLTAETCRYNFDPQSPASAQDSFKAKMEIINEWNRYGIDITSEMLSHPSVGKIGFALHTRFDSKEVFIPGDRFVPLVFMIYHGIIGYCCPSKSKEEILWGLLTGGQVFYEEDIANELCISRYYIQNIPAMLLYDKKMTGFEQTDSSAKAYYEDNSYVEADFAANTYVVIVNGTLVGQDFSVFAPGQTQNTYLAYSFEERDFTYPMPSGFVGQSIKTFMLTEKKPVEITGIIQESDNNYITLRLPAMTPIKLTTA